jgi:ATP adenylyltransferase
VIRVLEPGNLAVSPQAITGGLPCRFCPNNGHDLVVLDQPGGFAIPSYGALVEGWLLLVSTRHIHALSELSEEEWSDFDCLREAAIARVENHYGPTVSFEHGAAGSGRMAGCGVDHAHMHIVPIQTDLRSAIAAISHDVGTFAWQAAKCRPTNEGASDYIWLADATGTWITESQGLPSQVVRRAIANQLGEATWDWKLDHRMPLVEATARSLNAG